MLEWSPLKLVTHTVRQNVDQGNFLQQVRYPGRYADALIPLQNMLTFSRPESHSSGSGGLYSTIKRESAGSAARALLINITVSDTSSIPLWQSYLPCPSIQPTVSHLVLPDMSEVFRLRPQ